MILYVTVSVKSMWKSHNIMMIVDFTLISIFDMTFLSQYLRYQNIFSQNGLYIILDNRKKRLWLGFHRQGHISDICLHYSTIFYVHVNKCLCIMWILSIMNDMQCNWHNKKNILKFRLRLLLCKPLDVSTRKIK